MDEAEVDEPEPEVEEVEEESEPEVEVEGDPERDRRFLFCLVGEERPWPLDLPILPRLRMVRSLADSEEEEDTELDRFLRAGTQEGERPRDRDLWAFLVLRLGDGEAGRTRGAESPLREGRSLERGREEERSRERRLRMSSPRCVREGKRRRGHDGERRRSRGWYGGWSRLLRKGRRGRSRRLFVSRFVSSRRWYRDGDGSRLLSLALPVLLRER